MSNESNNVYFYIYSVEKILIFRENATKMLNAFALLLKGMY